MENGFDTSFAQKLSNPFELKTDAFKSPQASPEDKEAGLLDIPSSLRDNFLQGLSLLKNSQPSLKYSDCFTIEQAFGNTPRKGDIKDIQRLIKVEPDGIFGDNSLSALQQYFANYNIIIDTTGVGTGVGYQRSLVGIKSGEERLISKPNDIKEANTLIDELTTNTRQIVGAVRQDISNLMANIDGNIEGMTEAGKELLDLIQKLTTNEGAKEISEDILGLYRIIKSVLTDSTPEERQSLLKETKELLLLEVGKYLILPPEQQARQKGKLTGYIIGQLITAKGIGTVGTKLTQICEKAGIAIQGLQTGPKLAYAGEAYATGATNTINTGAEVLGVGGVVAEKKGGDMMEARTNGDPLQRKEAFEKFGFTKRAELAKYINESILQFDFPPEMIQSLRTGISEFVETGESKIFNELKTTKSNYAERIQRFEMGIDLEIGRKLEKYFAGYCESVNKLFPRFNKNPEIVRQELLNTSIDFEKFLEKAGKGIRIEKKSDWERRYLNESNELIELSGNDSSEITTISDLIYILKHE